MRTRTLASTHLPTLPVSAFVTTAVALALLLAAAPAKSHGHRNGKAVVDAVCIQCHGPSAHVTAAKGAPKIGDKKAWADRSARGLTSLTKNALTGIRNMPAHGGSPDLSDLEIERAITYMVNASGGKWQTPITRTAVVERTGEEVVQAYCHACHQEGLGGAPRIGDRSAWVPRARDGFEVLLRSAVNGHGGMPPRGGVSNLTDRELEGAIAYMLNPVPLIARGHAVVVPVKLEPNHQVVNGTEIYFGAVSADAIRKMHRTPDKERMMHGGIPEGPGYYHLNISLFDSETKNSIKDATVEARVIDPVRGDDVKMLEPMMFNETISYGNYFRMPGRDQYIISIAIRRPQAQPEIHASFQFKPQ